MSKKPIESARDAGTSAHVETESDLEKLLIAVRGAAARKAIEMVALDIRKIASFADFFLICSGTSSRQIQAIVDEVRERLRAERGSRPLHVEGYEAGEWVLMDYGDLIVHVFKDESRKFYQLERLWRDAERVELPADL
jgi:ribosome-associated protein